MSAFEGIRPMFTFVNSTAQDRASNLKSWSKDRQRPSKSDLPEEWLKTKVLNEEKDAIPSGCCGWMHTLW